jgi:hypothetical protein
MRLPVVYVERSPHAAVRRTIRDGGWGFRSILIGSCCIPQQKHVAAGAEAMPRYTLETIIIILLLLWLLGGFIVPFGGGLIHLLLVVILIVVVIRLLQGRSAL